MRMRIKVGDLILKIIKKNFNRITSLQEGRTAFADRKKGTRLLLNSHR
jgi:hypothetical protein